MNGEKPENFEPPRTLMGRRARRLWRALAPICDAAGTLHAGTRPLLAAYCASLGEIEAEPAEAHPADLARVRSLSRLLGLGK